MSQKMMQLLSYIYLHSPQRVYKLRQTQKKQISLPQLSAGSSGLVNEACIGSTGVNLLFSFLLVRWSHREMGISQKHVHRRALSAMNLLVLVRHLWSLAFFHSPASTL